MWARWGGIFTAGMLFFPDFADLDLSEAVSYDLTIGFPRPSSHPAMNDKATVADTPDAGPGCQSIHPIGPVALYRRKLHGCCFVNHGRSSS